jgi:ribosomal protein S18 acetylase RimI-like enzyme
MRQQAERAITGTVEWVAPDGVSFRGAAADDARAIATLWNRARQATKEHSRRLPFADLLDAVYQRLADPAGRFLLAFDGEALVGMVHASIVTRPAGATGTASRQMQLSMLAVDPASWRRGLGRTLVARCIELARSRRVEAVRLWSDAGNRPATKLYKKLGFSFEHRWCLDIDGDLSVQYRYALD